MTRALKVWQCFDLDLIAGESNCIALTSDSEFYLYDLKIEIVLANDQVETAIEAIQTAAKTGRIGDGKIFVIDLEQAIRIRTGEKDSDAV